MPQFLLEVQKKFDAILTNPPFGLLDARWIQEPGYLRYLIISWPSAPCIGFYMKDNGKAAIIIGGHARYQKLLEKGKNRFFFNYLLADTMSLTSFPLMVKNSIPDKELPLIHDWCSLMDANSQPSGAAPLKDAERDKVVDSFEELYERMVNCNLPSPRLW